MSGTKQTNVRESEQKPIDAVSNDETSDWRTYGLAGVALLQAVTLSLFGPDGNSVAVTAFLVAWIGGIGGVIYDIRQRKSLWDGVTWLWVPGTLVPFLSHGVIAIYALSRFRRTQDRDLPWYTLIWVSLVIQFASMILGPSSTGAMEGVYLSTLFLTFPLIPYAVYADGSSINRRSQKSLSVRFWAVITAIWGFNILTVPAYAFVRRRLLQNTTDLGEALDEAEKHVDTGQEHLSNDRFDRASGVFANAESVLDPVRGVDFDNPGRAERLNKLTKRLERSQETLEETRRSARAEQAQTEYETARNAAQSKFAEAERAAEDGDYDQAVNLSADAVDRAAAAIKCTADTDLEPDEAVSLRKEIIDSRADWEREWLIGRINAAREADAADHEQALDELDAVLTALDETDALSGRNLDIVREEARETYSRVLVAGAEMKLDEASELADADDPESAREVYADVIDEVSEAVTTVEDRGLDGAADLERIRERAEVGYVDARVAAIEAQIRAGIEAFEASEFETARDTFTAAAEEADEARDTVSDEECRDRLAHLREVAEDDADAARRAVLGIGGGTADLRNPDDKASTDKVSVADDGSARVENGDETDPSGSASGGPPDIIPVAPDIDVSYADIAKGEQIGEGGSADVYRVTADFDGATYDAALKEPRMRGTLHADTMESFVAEAETWANLDDHDFIVEVMAWDSTPLPWLLLEYMDGGDLTRYAGELPVEQAIWTARCVTEGVHHAHSHGIAHLDLKPENVLFRTTGPDTWPVPKVADWGLARALLHDDGGVDGMSPRFAAPEQIDAERFGDPDQMTDIYQLGAVFYDLFVGHPPFQGEGGEVLTRVVEDEVTPPSEANPSLPAEIDDALLPALEREKADRYESVLYLRDALADLADPSGG